MAFRTEYIDIDGSLNVDGSIFQYGVEFIGDVTQVYVDGSLAFRDTSIADIWVELGGIDTSLGDYVQKAGDTMSGNLTIDTSGLIVKGSVDSDMIISDRGINLQQVLMPQTSIDASLLIDASGNIDDGIHWYFMSYISDGGETSGNWPVAYPSVTCDSSSGQVQLEWDIATDYRVIGYKIYRTKALEAYVGQAYLLVTINDVNTIDYLDNIPDSSLTGVSGFGFSKPNTTNNLIQLNGVGVLYTDAFITYFGVNAAAANTQGSGLYIGSNAGKVNTIGTSNTFLGLNTGQANTTGTDNTYVGTNAGYKNIEGDRNVNIGNSVGSQMNAFSYNTLIGWGAHGRQSTSVSYNTIIGAYAAYGTFALGANNTMLGYGVGYNCEGANNTMVGYAAGFDAVGSNNVFLGYEAGKDEVGNNKLYIANTDTISPLIYGEFDNDLVQINNNLGIGKYPVVTLDVSGQISVNSNKIVNLDTPTDSSDAVNKYYVDVYNAIQDVSIAALDASISDAMDIGSYVNSSTYYDGSLNNIRATYIPDASLSTDFFWNSGSLEVSTAFGDVTAGSQNDNEIAIWNATAKQIEGDSNLKWDGDDLNIGSKIILNLTNSTIHGYDSATGIGLTLRGGESSGLGILAGPLMLIGGDQTGGGSDGGNIIIYGGAGDNTGKIYLGTGTSGKLSNNEAEINVVAYDTGTGLLTYQAASYSQAYIDGSLGYIDTSINDLWTNFDNYETKTNLDASLSNKLDINAGSDSSTSSEIRFDKTIGYVYGTIDTPITGDITLSASDGLLGCVSLVIHNDSSLSFPTWSQLLSGTYAADVNNFIYMQYIDPSNYLYTISQIQ